MTGRREQKFIGGKERADEESAGLNLERESSRADTKRRRRRKGHGKGSGWSDSNRDGEIGRGVKRADGDKEKTKMD